MWMELKKSKKNKCAILWIGLLLVWCSTASAQNPTQDMDYWVQIDDLKNDLAQIEKTMMDLPDVVNPSELRVCLRDNKYALVHKAGKDRDAAILIQDKLSQHLKSKFSTSVVQYDPAQCFYTAYIFNKNNQVKFAKPSASVKKKDPTQPEVHIHPDFQRGASPKKETTNRAEVVMDSMVQVLPEVSIQVFLSNLDINRITCMGDRPVKDIVYSAEKGVTTKINGSNAFIKLQMHQASPSAVPEVIDEPVELYVVCGNDNDVYTLIGIPKKIPAQWVQLISKTGNIKKNLTLFEGKDFERKLITFMRQAWTEDFPDSYTVKDINCQIFPPDFGWLDIALKRRVSIEGEGFILKEFIMRLNPDAGIITKEIQEKDFLVPDISSNPLAMTLDSMTLKKDTITRLFVVERSVNDSGVNISRTKN